MPISVSDDTLRIDGFETRERDIVTYFNGLHDPDDEEKLITLLKLGILAQSSVGTTMDAKYVETEFNRLKDKFDQRMNDIFEPNGTMDDKLVEHFGQDGKVIKKIFDPDTEGTPLNRLKAALHDEIVEIRDKIMEQKGREIEAMHGTQKGIEFEDFCQPFLEKTARSCFDIVERTGTATTEGSTSKKGDFLATLKGSGKKIIFEMKRRQEISVPEIKRELNKAMETRNADYAVLISRHQQMLNPTIGWFHEIDDNKLICAVAKDEEDEENGWVIEIAYKWARQRVVSASDNQIGVDPELIKQNVNDIKSSIDQIKKIQTQCKKIRDATGMIENTINNEEPNIKAKINEIISSMDSTSQS